MNGSVHTVPVYLGASQPRSGEKCPLIQYLQMRAQENLFFSQAHIYLSLYPLAQVIAEWEVNWEGDNNLIITLYKPPHVAKFITRICFFHHSNHAPYEGC